MTAARTQIHLLTYLLTYRFKMVFTAVNKQMIKSLRQLKVAVHERFFKNFDREIGHAEELTACLQKLINMGWQKESQSVGYLHCTHG